MKTRISALLQENKGSLTAEALLIAPLIILLLILFFRWGLVLREDLRAAAGGRERPQGDDGTAVQQNEGIRFLTGGPPARRIRDVDFLIDMGYSLKERMPVWFGGGSEGRNE